MDWDFGQDFDQYGTNDENIYYATNAREEMISFLQDAIHFALDSGKTKLSNTLRHIKNSEFNDPAEVCEEIWNIIKKLPHDEDMLHEYARVCRILSPGAS